MDKEELRKAFAREWEKHYSIEFLRERGFVRKKCVKCGKYFWTLDPERETCGDPECDGYRFIGDPPTKRRLGYVEAWKVFEGYMEGRGVPSVPRYPVVARWRDDLFFTIASIAVFQPYVVRGEVDPPENPLIIPQPCLRFEDVPNVGITGRHMTNFVMVGIHAFNKDRTVYWKEDVIRDIHGFLTKTLGIPEEEITYVEDVWMGGGNYGPSMEYFVRGLELGNAVFMQFEEGGKELSVKTVDHGAGLSRYAWITRGDPTAYDVVYEDVIPWFERNVGIRLDRERLMRFYRMAGSLDATERDVSAELKRIGVPEEAQAMYAILDHTKTALFSIADGQLPSNSGAGYYIRLVLRRAFGLEEKMGWEIDYPGLVEQHAQALNNLFPELGEFVTVAGEVLEEEKKKYRRTVERGRRKVERMIEAGGVDFRLLYESYGVPPEVVVEIGKEKGVELKVPPDFYSRIGGEERKEEGGGIKVEGFPPTEKLYYKDEYATEFEATVLGHVNGYVVLDRTLFYPRGGGQEPDRGEINGFPVTDVIKVNDVILHRVEGDLKKGEKVKGRIDWKRRIRIMRHHTGAHILLYAARKVLGKHVWQQGAKKDEDMAHMDISHWKRITEEELKEMEREANRVIMENVEVTKTWMDRGEAERKYGLVIYQGGAVPGKTLRIVKIGDYDVEACGGTHVRRTGELGLFKIVRRESVRDGTERIYYVCGDMALKHVQEMEKELDTVSRVLRTPRGDLSRVVERIFSEWKDRGKKIEKLEALVVDLLGSSLEDNVFRGPLSPGAATELAKRLAERHGTAAVIGENGFLVAVGHRAEELAREIVRRCGGRISGSGRIVRGKVGECSSL